MLGKPRAIRRPSIGGKWSPDEDANLRGIVEQHGAKNWKRIASLLGFQYEKTRFRAPHRLIKRSSSIEYRNFTPTEAGISTRRS